MVGRREVQARDVFDLSVLFARMGSARDGLDDLRPLARAAIARVWEVDADASLGQVVAYLEPEHADVLGSAQAWEALQIAVVTALEPLAGPP